jgi:HD-like signal output (HDOD) protein
MNNRQQTSGCRVISIASGGSSRAPQQPSSVIALIRDQRAMNLAELANSIRADRDFCNAVTKAAFMEFGLPHLKLEDAIILLGGRRICNLASAQVSRGRSAIQPLWTLHRNSITPSANLCLLEAFPKEPRK